MGEGAERREGGGNESPTQTPLFPPIYMNFRGR